MEARFADPMAAKIGKDKITLTTDAMHYATPYERVIHAVGSTDDITMPSKAEAAGEFFAIENRSGGTIDIIDKEAGTNIVAALANGANSLLFCTGIAWMVVTET